MNDDLTLPPDEATAPLVRQSSYSLSSDTVPGFCIEGELGRGGMGVVYRATQTKLQRPVALKMILAGVHADARDLARFLAEAEAVAAVAHPHVVQVYEFGECAGRPYFAMEFLPGGSLAALLQSGKMAPLAATEMIRKIACGVHAAHQLGIVHRDLKPANVLMDAAGEPKVTDFGLAKRGQHDLTRTGVILGTPSYMSPEQAAGNAKFVGPAADVYALGVMLFECLAGRPPFQSEDTVSLVMKVIDELPPSVREFAPHVPRELDAICVKCLAKEPTERYATAAALADDLQRVLDGEQPSAMRSSVLGHLYSSLGHGRYSAEFAAFASIFYWLAALMPASEIVFTLALRGIVPFELGVVAQFARVVIFLGVVSYYRRGRLLPRTPPERVLWSVWGGYLVTCVAAGLCLRLRFGWAMEYEVQLYPTWALLAAMAFFMLAAGFWGWFYVVGIVFLMAAFAATALPDLAPLIFGGVWAIVLLVFARHLSRLAAESAHQARGEERTLEHKS